MKLFVVRHAEAQHNLSDEANDASSAKAHLTHKGIEQAKQLAVRLQTQDFDIIFTSQQDRTVETAQILNATRGIQMQQDSRLNDIRTGMQGRPFDEFRRALAASNDKWHVRFGTGESFEDEKQRAQEFLDELKDRPYNNVLVVTHGGIANIIYGLAHHLSNEQIFYRSIDNASIFSIEL